MSANVSDVIKTKLIDPLKTAEFVSPGDTIITAMAAAEPQEFFRHLPNLSESWRDVKIICANPSKDYECFKGDTLHGKVAFEVMFLTSAVRSLQGRGMLHYVPQHLSQWVANIKRTRPIKIFWGSCTPPDERGIFSLGPGACYEADMLRYADIRILEINPKLPFTNGATLFRESVVDYFIHSENALPTLPRATPTAVDQKIAEYIADLIPDGATIQLGIGGIPNALGHALLGKKDLGVHTEMINDTMQDLFEAGVITGRRKTLWPLKIVGAFALGSPSLYEFIHLNGMVELHPAEVVNDPYRIGRNYKMHSINTAVEVDITGQVCSESVGHRELSGVGGASDTHIGAQRSEGGRGIIALHSTGTNRATGKAFSKIVFELQPGAKVSISRNDIDTVVTEFGVASLKGRSVAERAKALIGIAAPEFREELTSQARKYHYI